MDRRLVYTTNILYQHHLSNQKQIYIYIYMYDRIIILENIYVEI